MDLMLQQRMEENSLDKAESGFPTEQMSSREEDENNIRPTTELGLSMDSSKKSTQMKLNSESGAGANAGSRADIMFVTTNALSELVWSPNRGLSLKCADCSLTEKKTFLSGNMVPSPPISIALSEEKDEIPAANRNFNSSQVVCHLDSQASDRVTLVNSPTRSKDIMPLYQTMSHQLGSSGEIKEFASKMENSVIAIKSEDDHLNKKGKAICSPADISGIRRNNILNIIENNFTTVRDHGLNIGSSFIELNEHKLRLEEVNLESENFEEGNFEIYKGKHVGIDTILYSESCKIKECRQPDTSVPFLTFPDRKHEAPASVIQDDKSQLSTGCSNIAPLEKRESSSENDLLLRKSASTFVKVGLAHGPADEAKQNGLQNMEILPRGEAVAVETSLNNRTVCLFQKEDKEIILSNVEVSGGSLKAEDDSHGSAESCNSGGLCLAGKRPWSSEHQLEIGKKKLKTKIHESPHCASVQRHESSFMNWILSMVKGLSKADPGGTSSLNLIMRPHLEHGSSNQHLMIQDKNQQPGCTSMGFETIFKALYCSGNSKDSEIMNLDHQSREDTGKLDLANKSCHNSTIPLVSGEENDELCKVTDISTKDHVRAGNGGPAYLQNVPHVDVSFVPEEHKSTAEKSNSLNITCGLGKHGLSSSNSTFRNGSDSPSDGLEANKHNFVDSSKSLMTDRTRPPESLWITRFSPKVSSLVVNSSQCNQHVGAAVEGSTENCVGFVKEQSVFEVGHEPSTEDRANVPNKVMQNCVANSVCSFGSIKIAEHTDQKFKSKLNPIQPSQRFKTSEAMASVFARRLDALRHIMPIGVSSNADVAKICFFCGIKGHKLQDCSEVTESELEDLLKKINSYDGAEKLSCFCIRCFQLNHWANRCPNMSSRKRSHSDGSIPLLDFRSSAKLVQIVGQDTLTNRNERSAPEKSDWGCQVAHPVRDGKKPMVDTRVTAGTRVSRKFSNIMVLNENAMDLNLTKNGLLETEFWGGKSMKNTARDFLQVEKQSKTSSSTENESKEVQISTFCNFVNRQIPAVPRVTFEAIKKLRLSRTDIIKWMHSPMSHFCLEGFYLRLRLRKGEEELGGTGYYVARINGVLRERSSGSSQIPLSVNIGGFKCLVESRFVSNQDFLEDELMAWWCSTLRCGGKLPSEEDTKVKLEERKNFGF